MQISSFILILWNGTGNNKKNRYQRAHTGETIGVRAEYNIYTYDRVLIDMESCVYREFSMMKIKI